MQAESTSSELHEELLLRNKYANNKAKLFNINTTKETASLVLASKVRRFSLSRLILKQGEDNYISYMHSYLIKYAFILLHAFNLFQHS